MRQKYPSGYITGGTIKALWQMEYDELPEYMKNALFRWHMNSLLKWQEMTPLDRYALIEEMEEERVL